MPMYRTAILFVYFACIAAVASNLFAEDSDLAEGIALLNGGRVAEAKQFFESVLAGDADNAEALYYLGRSYHWEYRHDKAAELYERAVKLDESNAVYRHWLGRAYAQQAMNAGIFRRPFLAKNSRQAFEKAVELDPDYLDARNDLMQYYMVAPGIVGGSMTKAREQAEEIFKRDKMRGHGAFGFIYGREEKYEEAEREFLAALDVAGESVEPYYWLGFYYARRDQYDRAHDMFERVIERKPDDMNAYYQIGRIAAETGSNLQRGKECLLRYLQVPTASVRGSHAWAYMRLGRIYEMEGDSLSARAAYESALKLDPGHEQAQAALKNMQ